MSAIIYYYYYYCYGLCGEGSKSCSGVILFFGSHAPSYDYLMDNEGFYFLHPDCSSNYICIISIHIYYNIA